MMLPSKTSGLKSSFFFFFKMRKEECLALGEGFSSCDIFVLL